MKKLLFMVVCLLLACTMLVSCATPTATPAASDGTTAAATSAAPTSIQVKFVYPIYDIGSESVTLPTGTVALDALQKAFDAVPKNQYGYTFINWYTDEAATKTLDKKAVFNSDTTLYAKWTKWDDATKAKVDPFLAELEIAKKTVLFPSMYEPAAFLDYYKFAYTFCHQGIDTHQLYDQVTPELIAELKSRREALVPIKTKEQVAMDIWGANIPAAADAADYSYFMLPDTKDFRPMMSAFLLDDQTKAKGNIIVCAGGGFVNREAPFEGIPACLYYNSIGYNAYLLQYRISPNERIDGALDLQRAIRYLRYNAAEKGIGGIDHIAASGYSAGGMTLVTCMLKLYGDVQPTSIYADYVPDAVDAVNSDIDVAIPIYGAMGPFETTNPKLPATFMAAGTDDALVVDGCLELYAFLKDRKVRTEMHLYDAVGHGFGMGTDFEGSNQLGDQLEAFLNVNFGHTPKIVAK